MSEEITSMEELNEEIDSSFETFQDEDVECWKKCKSYMESGEVLSVTVDGIASKGVVVTVEGIRGFIPASHLSLRRVDDLNDYLNKTVEAKVIEADSQKKRLVLSSRSVLKDQAEAAKKEKLAALVPGTIIEGVVETIKPYGAFIKIDDDITGLVHVSQISHKRIPDPGKVLKEGDTIKAKVINSNEGKLSLSIKALDENVPSQDVPEPRNVKLPKSESLGTSLGDLLKNIKI